MRTSRQLSLAVRNALACELARHPRCVCFCGGAAHGAAHSAQSVARQAGEPYERPVPKGEREPMYLLPCMHKAEWCCGRCAKCADCCSCTGPAEPVHTHSRMGQLALFMSARRSRAADKEASE